MKSNSAPEINAGSMADIAFLLLVFFLVTTTMDSDLGMLRKLPQIQENPIDLVVHQRNILPIMVNGSDELLVNGEILTINDLSAFVKEFIANPLDKLNMPEKKEERIPLLGTVSVSKQIVSLQSDTETSYGMYILVQNEIAKAYHELRNELALQKFGESYDTLQELNEVEKVNAIKQVYPQRISEAEPYSRNLASR